MPWWMSFRMLFDPSGIGSQRPLSFDLPALWLCHLPHSLQKIIRPSALAKLRISWEGCGALPSCTAAPASCPSPRAISGLCITVATARDLAAFVTFCIFLVDSSLMEFSRLNSWLGTSLVSEYSVAFALALLVSLVSFGRPCSRFASMTLVILACSEAVIAPAAFSGAMLAAT